MCGIAGAVSLTGEPIPGLARRLHVMKGLLEHRGPDGHGTWTSADGIAGLAHTRLAIIDLSEAAAQPMQGPHDSAIAFNGEIYNFREIRSANSARGWLYGSHSDTEAILSEYFECGQAAPEALRGMFAFAVWDGRTKEMFLARDRFGIKPLYYMEADGVVYFASEAKALLPFAPSIETDPVALAEYLTFQYTIGDRTLFRGIRQLMPGHRMNVRRGGISVSRYWDVHYEPDFGKAEGAFIEELRELLADSVAAHLVSDVEVGTYLSGGLDSSLIALLASKSAGRGLQGFHGRFLEHSGYDESHYAQVVSAEMGGELHCRDITATDFEDSFAKVIYHLDFPVAGPGSFAQYMVSELASQKVKVVLAGQGGDEIFGGYARYLVAYLEQCLKAAIDGTYLDGHFVVTLESIIPNLPVLQEYKPLISDFWREGLFGELDDRFFRLIDRRGDMENEFLWHELDMDGVRTSFDETFSNAANVRKEAYFDRMTHFEFKTLLPALLTVEDRMSMAHGLESRVPFLDHRLIEFAATVPADVKFRNGQLKHLLRESFSSDIPKPLLHRRDKMGFPVPLREWLAGPLHDFAMDTLRSLASSGRPYVDGSAVAASSLVGGRYSRKTWALMSLEIWYQTFHDQAQRYRSLVTE